jgi:hypothetical protein
MDFNSIGDKEAFKEDVVKDVATAAKIDMEHIKVTELRAGSVIVDMLIKKSAGDVQNIVQDLEMQLKSPNSLLMQGKMTSKTKVEKNVDFTSPAAGGGRRFGLRGGRRALKRALELSHLLIGLISKEYFCDHKSVSTSPNPTGI